MHWLQNAFSSSSSSSSSSSPSSSPKLNFTIGYKRNARGSRSRRGSQTQPRLTRQRKLRHLSEVDVKNLSLTNRRSSSSPSSPVSCSPSGLNDCSARSSSAMPQPLPLPESSMLVRRGLVLPSSNSGNSPLPYPREEIRTRGEAEVRDGADFSKEDRKGEGSLSSPATGSRFAYQTFDKRSEHVDFWSTNSPTDDGRKVVRDPDIRLNFPPRSAPTSGFSSPVLSPKRFSSGDILPSSQTYQVWSALDCPPLDMLAGFSYRTSPETNMHTPNRSPLHSPRAKSPCLNPKSPSGASSPLHHKFSSETATSWLESNSHVTVHPLPLPPGAPLPSQSSFVHQTTAKPEPSTKSRWKKGKLLGRGTFGSVFEGTNSETGALCAMKEVDLIPDDPKSVECIKQLEQEIKVLSQLKHPNIVQYYGCEIVEDHFYIYLEYVHPGSINKYVREHCGAITESVVRNFTRHILSGLAYLHGKKTIHRDIKGANLLVDATGVVKLADFGMAKHLSGHTANLSLKGSPYWMAPEVLQAAMRNETNRDVALAVDIWSLGCTVIEMLTEKPPWSELEGPAAMFKVLRETPPIPETLSAEGKDFLQCCFRRNPAERPPALTLLEHPFLKNSHHVEMQAFTQAFSGIQLRDKAHSPRDRDPYRSDLISCSGTQTIRGNLQYNGFKETGQQSHHETCDSVMATRHSPRSTLEALPSLSPPQSNHSSSNSLPYHNALNSTHPVTTHTHHRQAFFRKSS